MLLRYLPPYPWEKVLRFLSVRAIKGIEAVKNNEYMRAAGICDPDGNTLFGWVRVCHSPEKSALRVTVSKSLLSVQRQVLERIRHLFDLSCDPSIIYDRLQAMNSLKPNLCILGTRVPGCFNGFEMAARAVLGQQISVKAAGTLASRIVDAYGTPIQTGIEGLTHIFPTPEDIAALNGSIENSFGELGVIGARSRTICELAQAVARKDIDLDPSAQPEEEMSHLMAIRGIGSWTAQYIAMRTMKWQDAFLETDAGVKKALQPYASKELLKMAEAWRPWRSYAVFNLWNSLDA